MRVIDFHVHAVPDQLAPKAIAQLCDTFNVKLHYDGTIGGLRERMAATGVSASVVVPVATKPEQVRSINDWAACANSEDVICFGAVHPDYERIEKEIDRIITLGLKGIKIQPDWQGCAVDDPKMMRTFGAAEGRLVVIVHAGQEIEPFPKVLSTPAAIRKVHDTFPYLTLIAAHMGGFRMWDEVREHLLGTEVYFDVSYCPPEDLADDDFRDMILTHGVDRILFATDGPFGDAEKDLARLRGLGLPEDALAAILYHNADALLGFS